MRKESASRREILERLKRADGLTAGDLATALGLTEAAIRQHLDGLATQGLVEGRTRAAAGRGRPATEWRLTDLARDLFPDHHADLTIELLGAIREAVGEDGLDRVIAARAASQEAAYRKRVDGATLARRTEQLAAVRSAEGYLAEVRADGDDLLLVEHHCPICDAAAACQGLCRSELELFRRVLGEEAAVEREQHLLAGDQRCVYRITRS